MYMVYPAIATRTNSTFIVVLFVTGVVDTISSVIKLPLFHLSRSSFDNA